MAPGSWTSDSSTPAVGPASMGLSDSLYWAVIGGVQVWQLVVILGAVTSPTRVPVAVLVVVHLGIAALAFLARHSILWGAVVCVAVLGAAALDLYACTSIVDPLAFTTIWTMNLMMLGPVGALRGWPGTVVGLVTVAYATTIFRVVQPDWTVLHGTMVTTGLTMVIAGSVLTRYLYRFAGDADAEAAGAMEAQHALSVSRSAGREAADLARTLHDTAINTLAAVANGGAATTDRALVRERSARDAHTLQQVLAGQSIPEASTDLSDIGVRTVGITIDRVLPGKDALDQLEQATPPEVLRALRAAADEAVTNAAKHAGAERVTVSVRRNPHLEIEVKDRGIGFRQPTPSGRGLSESILARAEEVGATVDVVSDPGAGTTVTLSWVEPGEVDEQPPLTADTASPADRVRRWACWAWAAGVVGIGVVIEYAPRPGELTATYPALAVVGLASLVSWALAGRTAQIPRWWAAVLVALVPVAFTLGYLGVEDEPYLWQAISLTPLPVILLVHRRRAELLASAGALVVTVAVLAAVVADGDGSRAALVVVGAVPQLGLVLGWMVFHRVVGTVAEESESARRRAAESRAALDATRAAQAVRARWQQAGVERALSVLTDLATGAADPRDDAVREACAEQERALRQVMQLSPEVVHLGPWIARALADARARGVELDVRSSEVDAPDQHAAALLGEVLISSVDATAPGARLTVGVFGDGSQGRLLVVGRERVPEPSVPSQWRVVTEVLDDQVLTEVVWPRPSVSG